MLDEVASTQDVLQGSNLTSGDVCVAELQNKGRGRLDREFISQKYLGLTFSLIIQPNIPRDTWGIIPLLIGKTCAEVLTQICETDIKTKWPNDLITNSEKKLGGILVELHSNKIAQAELHCGIGINVNTTLKQLPVIEATSLYLETNKEWDRNLLLVEILKKLEINLKKLENHEELEIEKWCKTISQEVEITPVVGAKFYGLATGISSAGELRLADGQLIHAGIIRHLRSN